MTHKMVEEIASKNGRFYGRCACKWSFVTFSGIRHYTKYVNAHLDTGVAYRGHEL